MAAPDRIFAWAVVQEEGSDLRSSPSRVKQTDLDLPFDIDSLKKAVKAEFAQRLQHVDTADLKVYAGDKELATLSALVVDQTVGGCEENPLRLTYPPRAGTPPEGAATALLDKMEALRVTFDKKFEEIQASVAVARTLSWAEQERAMKPATNSHQSKPEQQAFKKALIKHYEAGFRVDAQSSTFVRSSNRHAASHAKCSVTGAIVEIANCFAGHIIPSSSRKAAPSFGIAMRDINDVQNGLLFAAPIELLMHPPLRFCFFPNLLNETVTFKLLDSDLAGTVIEGTGKTFGAVDETQLHLPTGKRPWKRVLWIHARVAITDAIKAQLIKKEDWSEQLAMLESLLTKTVATRDSDDTVSSWLAKIPAGAAAGAVEDT